MIKRRLLSVFFKGIPYKEKKKGNWYYVKYDTYYGWVESDCVTYIIPNNITYNNSNVEYSKKELDSLYDNIFEIEI